jgi:hypothetical protein
LSELLAIEKLAEDHKVVEASKFAQELHKSLVLGQTRYMCRWGTLSDGHEKITDAQRFYQAVRELYYIAGNIQDVKAQAMILEADVLDATEALDNAKTPAEKLRANGNLLKAKTALTRARVSIEDQLRMVDEYYKIYKELKPVVEAKYPQGIEQAEADNWAAVATYRAGVETVTGQAQLLRHIPLDPSTKAKLGVALDKPELVAWYATREREKILKLLEDSSVVPGTNQAPSLKSLVARLLEGEKNENLLASVR